MVKEVLFYFYGQFFPRFPRFFPTLGKNEGFFYFLYFLTSFFIFFLLFPKKCPIFPKIEGFSGKLWEKDCFALFSAVLLQRRRNKTTPKCFGDLETTYDYFII